MKLGEAILAGKADAYGRFSDIIRARGGTYRETVERIHALFKEAGRSTTDAEIDAMFIECDDS